MIRTLYRSSAPSFLGTSENQQPHNHDVKNYLPRDKLNTNVEKKRLPDESDFRAMVGMEAATELEETIDGNTTGNRESKENSSSIRL